MLPSQKQPNPQESLPTKEELEQEIKERQSDSALIPSCWREERMKGASVTELDRDCDRTHIFR